MSPFKVLQCTIAGALLAFGLTRGVENTIDNYNIAKIANVSFLNPAYLLPVTFNGWSMVDARKVLAPKLDKKGEGSCVHVTPVYPSYQTITTLSDGKKVCCDIDPKRLNIPVVENNGSYYFYCGSFPNQQVVSLPVN
ncbi:hypothetical protein [Photobacterium damselae]|uniref:Uncharacterized protein n=1 Tax=Photobacterium damselae subsp. damselae TaxID=85581 RepID=A0A850QZR1_PHODD|nr:hypothetical protein [Photobacterium damselae]KAB1182249.1 hypothetical protein F6450_07205 [Photobacterium damselae subsp. damselae]NVP00391.1 hypothetical protein [Photobacterium damselae subsp. damselae]